MYKHPLIIAIAISITLTGVAAYPVMAAKLNAKPLPHERDLQSKFVETDDSTTIIPPTATRFSRRHDYRQDEKDKKEKDELAKKQQVDDAKKSQDQRVDAAKKYEQTAIDANNQAVALGKAGRWEEAIEQHEKAVQYAPGNKQFLINLSAARTSYGQARMAHNDLSGAVSMFRKAMLAAPDNGLAGKSLVACLKKMGYDASNPNTRIELGDQLVASNDLPGASIEYNAAMQLEPSARVYVKLGDLCFKYGQIPTAMNNYLEAIKKDPECGAAYRQLGFCQMQRRDSTSAAASLRKAVILDSKDVAAGDALVSMWRQQLAKNPLLAENHLGLAGALQLTGDFGGAESEYQKLEVLDAKNPSLQSGRASLVRAIQHAKAEKYKLAADTLYGQGLHRESLQQIAQAVQLEPRNATYQFLLGECLEHVGDYANAHQAYLTCVLIDPENNREAASRIRALKDRGFVAGAQPQATQARVNNQYGQQSQQVAAPPQQMQQPMQQQMQQQMPQQMAPQIMSPSQQVPAMGFRKNMYEGGSGAGNMPDGAQMGFRTHDESAEAIDRQRAAAAQAAANAAAQAAAAPQTLVASNDVLARVTEAESARDYSGAIKILTEISTSQNNLQNPDIHHRLAVNLLAAGQISEAISEFRIASALAPTKKAYSDDLAQALAINKRSLMTENGATGAIK